jgi:hypothetical protein
MPITRRTVLGLFGAGAGFGLLPSIAAPYPIIHVSKDPNCGCCSKWIEHLHAAGFQTEVSDVTDMGTVKSKLSVPEVLYSCHTAQIAGFVIEGHVPAAAIRRLLAERPKALGLAVPGMPLGSPGMEVPGTPDEIYEVILFDRLQRKSYARYKGTTEVL